MEIDSIKYKHSVKMSTVIFFRYTLKNKIDLVQKLGLSKNLFLNLLLVFSGAFENY